MKKICIIFCGGTITMKKNKSGALEPFHDANDLIKMVPEVEKFANFSFIQLVNIDSTNMDPLIWTKITKTIIEKKMDYDGFVITHGTDTMAYTASALSYALHNINKPIIITGSQKPLKDIPSDAPNNLINAVIAATQMKGGVLIVFGQKILQGNRSTKISESDLEPFDSPMVPPVGIIRLEHEINNIYIQKNHKDFLNNINFDSNIITVKITPGLSNKNLEKIFFSGYKGVILESYGPGNIPDSLMPFINKAKENDLPVIILSQCKNGVTKMSLYEVGRQAFVGGGIPGGDMTIEAASTKLMWGLAQTRDIKKIKELFATNIAGEVTINK
ncbi:hypothetical protein CO165_01430 [Candidatus Roizmanbacteria bacterium CG_4_9_14_3_um_filter_33_18]|uniref:asparaginase n=2 Tax=Candidatus Roizmaniibacteriota TaxID=1752723 RepID=A0A2M7XYN4_9BACT|nr:MAG: hypothetical protein COW97_00540 [Candidatus Roizmanbacteria bacterium CG22_combo_CG10-13_8_21_14_all_34_12]PJA55833.1 MAG: hypothetical protein CO165_01430 [Candidatus Roizmanbacteria bacterium CG_4_9_14_3_um_filter_33_18]